jgi:hypothetical protein
LGAIIKLLYFIVRFNHDGLSSFSFPVDADTVPSILSCIDDCICTEVLFEAFSASFNTLAFSMAKRAAGLAEIAREDRTENVPVPESRLEGLMDLDQANASGVLRIDRNATNGDVDDCDIVAAAAAAADDTDDEMAGETEEPWVVDESTTDAINGD